MSNVKLLILTATVILGCTTTYIATRPAPLESCETAINPIKAQIDTAGCKMIARGGSAEHTIYQFACLSNMTEIAVLLTKPASEIDKVAAQDANMTFQFACRLEGANIANVYLHKGEIHAEAGQQADNSSTLREGQE